MANRYRVFNFESQTVGEASPLSNMDRQVLEGLERVGGAATPLELALETDLLGQEVGEELRSLHERGLVASRHIVDGAESDVYFLSAKGRKMVSSG